jgi:membrane fusion protein (multidrug efflux system)
MTSLSRSLSACLLTTSFLALGLAACGKQEAPQKPGGTMPAMPVSVRAVSAQEVPLLIEAVGQAEGSKAVEVRARVTGLVEKQRYQEGERVKAGAPLYQIERAPFEIALQQARAGLQQQNAQLEQARREAKRLKPLAEQQAISQRDYDQAASQLSLAEAGIAAAQARVREAQLNLSYTTVTAPISGISGRSQKSEGSLVNPANDSLLTTVTQTHPIWVRFSFAQAELAQLQNAKNPQVNMLDAAGKVIGQAGKLNFAGSTVDNKLGTVQLRAEFANPDLTVLPGQFVRAQVTAGQISGFLLPHAAVMQNDKGKMVWTVKDGKATPTPVETAGWMWSDNEWVVTKGLQNGDQVVIDNLLKIRPGAPLAPKAASAAASAPTPASGASSAPPASTASMASTPAASR